MWIAIVTLLNLTICIAEIKPWSENHCDAAYQFHFHHCYDTTIHACPNDHVYDRLRLHPCSSAITKGNHIKSLFVSFPCNLKEYTNCLHSIPAVVRNTEITKVFLSHNADGWLLSKIRLYD